MTQWTEIYEQYLQGKMTRYELPEPEGLRNWWRWISPKISGLPIPSLEPEYLGNKLILTSNYKEFDGRQNTIVWEVEFAPEQFAVKDCRKIFIDGTLMEEVFHEYHDIRQLTQYAYEIVYAMVNRWAEEITERFWTFHSEGKRAVKSFSPNARKEYERGKEYPWFVKDSIMKITTRMRIGWAKHILKRWADPILAEYQQELEWDKKIFAFSRSRSSLNMIPKEAMAMLHNDASPEMRQDMNIHWYRVLLCEAYQTGYGIENKPLTVLRECLEIIAGNRTLRRSLHQLPVSGMPSADVVIPLCRMVKDGLDLRRPIGKNKYRWVAIAGLRQRGLGLKDLQKVYDLIVYAPDYQFKEMAKQRMKMHPLASIANNIVEMVDFPEPLNRGETLLGYWTRARRWHSLNQWAKYFTIPGETVLPEPPKGDPMPEGVRFLGTAQELYDESYEMSHCVGTYVRKAMNNDCYIFHAEYEGVPCTVEMTPVGEVAQIQGQHDHDNTATHHFYPIFEAWGKTWQCKRPPEPEGKTFEQIFQLEDIMF